MYGLGWYLEDFTNRPHEILSLSFNLLVIATVLVAGAGNIINDYFDVRADRINKPERLIIGVHVKRRVAILVNWFMNLCAFGIAIYLSYELNSFWYLFVFASTISLLWSYSMTYKRKFIIGNLVVATMTGLVPVLVGFYFFHKLGTHDMSINDANYQEMNLMIGKLSWIVGALGIFAFLLNLSREIVKDIEDIEGDKLLHAKTLAIKFGKKRASHYANAILLVTGVLLAFFLFDARTVALELLPLAIAALLFMIVASALLIKADTKKDFKRVNNVIKLAMICGILIPVYIRIILHYT